MDAQTLYTIGYYEYGEAYYGSENGLRYRVAREPLENVRYTPPEKRGEAVLLASVWPEPYGYGATDESLIRNHEFPFSREGLEEAVKWLQEQVGE